MKNEHILDILDEKAFGEFSPAEHAAIKSHTTKCSACLNAYESAKITSILLKTNNTQSFEPPPFFQARIIANLREKQAKISPFFAFARMWKASGTLVALMITTVLALIVLTVFAPSYKASAMEIDSADIVILDEKILPREPSNEQIFQMVYGAEDNIDK